MSRISNIKNILIEEIMGDVVYKNCVDIRIQFHAGEEIIDVYPKSSTLDYNVSIQDLLDCNGLNLQGRKC